MPCDTWPVNWNGPISYRKPSSDEQPGPPFSPEVAKREYGRYNGESMRMMMGPIGVGMYVDGWTLKTMKRTQHDWRGRGRILGRHKPIVQIATVRGVDIQVARVLRRGGRAKAWMGERGNGRVVVVSAPSKSKNGPFEKKARCCGADSNQTWEVRDEISVDRGVRERGQREQRDDRGETRHCLGSDSVVH